MADRLTELLAQNAGLGDEEAALQLQMLRAKTLRDRAAEDPRRTTGKGGMFSALARGVNAYRGGTMEAEADTTRAGLDARRMELRQAAQESVGGLPSLSGGYDPQTGTPLPPPEEALAAHRALGRALGFAPDKGLVAQGASVAEGAAKAQEAADKRAQEAMIKMVTLDNGERVPVASLKLAWDAFKGGSSQQGGHQTLLMPDAETLANDNEAKKARAAAGNPGQIITTRDPNTNEPIQARSQGTSAAPINLTVPGAGGAPAKTVVAQPPYKPQTGPEVKALKEFKEEVKAVERIVPAFKDEYAGQGVTGDLKRSLAGALGSSGPKDWQAMEAWWADYDKLVALPERHEFFGSALTPVEQTAWKNAQIVKASRDPAMIKQTLSIMRAAAKRVLKEEEARQVSNYRSPAAVGAAPAETSEEEKAARRAKYLKKGG